MVMEFRAGKRVGVVVVVVVGDTLDVGALSWQPHAYKFYPLQIVQPGHAYNGLAFYQLTNTRQQKNFPTMDDYSRRREEGTPSSNSISSCTGKLNLNIVGRNKKRAETVCSKTYHHHMMKCSQVKKCHLSYEFIVWSYQETGQWGWMDTDDDGAGFFSMGYCW